MNIRRFVITALKKFRQTYDESIPTGLPTGGSAGQALVKTSAANGDVQWAARAAFENNESPYGVKYLTITDGGINRISFSSASGGKVFYLHSSDDYGLGDDEDPIWLASDKYVDDKIAEALGVSGGGRVVVGEERLLGEWVEDGVTYDRYEKVINFGAMPNSGTKTVQHGITNIHRYVKLYGEATSSSNNITIPFVSADGSLFTYLAVGARNITITTNSDRSGFAAYIYLEFLRTRS